MELAVWEMGQGFEELMERIKGAFANELGIRMARKYLQGLLSPAGKKWMADGGKPWGRDTLWTTAVFVPWEIQSERFTG